MSNFLKMILGFLFLVFNIQVKLGGITLDIVPDFIGYGLIFLATKGLLEWSPCFQKTRKYAVIAFVISVCRIIAQNINANFKTDKIYELNSQLRGAWIAVAVSRFIYCFLGLTDLDSLTAELGIEGMESTILVLISAVTFVVEAFFVLTLNQNRMLIEEKKKVEQKKERKKENESANTKIYSADSFFRRFFPIFLYFH